VLTPDGTVLARRAREFRGARLEGLLADWSPDDRHTLTMLLERLAQAVRNEK
jgi:DNA-binding MarR family transcriptional regulator